MAPFLHECVCGLLPGVGLLNDPFLKKSVKIPGKYRIGFILGRFTTRCFIQFRILNTNPFCQKMYHVFAADGDTVCVISPSRSTRLPSPYTESAHSSHRGRFSARPRRPHRRARHDSPSPPSLTPLVDGEPRVGRALPYPARRVLLTWACT